MIVKADERRFRHGGQCDRYPDGLHFEPVFIYTDIQISQYERGNPESIVNQNQ